MGQRIRGCPCCGSEPPGRCICCCGNPTQWLLVVKDANNQGKDVLCDVGYNPGENTEDTEAECASLNGSFILYGPEMEHCIIKDSYQNDRVINEYDIRHWISQPFTINGVTEDYSYDTIFNGITRHLFQREYVWLLRCQSAFADLINGYFMLYLIPTLFLNKRASSLDIDGVPGRLDGRYHVNTNCQGCHIFVYPRDPNSPYQDYDFYIGCFCAYWATFTKNTEGPPDTRCSDGYIVDDRLNFAYGLSQCNMPHRNNPTQTLDLRWLA